MWVFWQLRFSIHIYITYHIILETLIISIFMGLQSSVLPLPSSGYLVGGTGYNIVVGLLLQFYGKGIDISGLPRIKSPILFENIF